MLWHVSARLAQRCGALLGVRVQTLSGVAHEILERAGAERRSGDALFPIVVRHEARAEPLLRNAFERLDDGYAIVAVTVADLLDAGLEPEQIQPLERRLSGLRDAERGRAVLRVAGRVAARLREHGIERDADRLTRAARLLAEGAAARLPARAVWIHGYAEATGRAAQLLEQLVAVHGARVLIDRPPSPLSAGTLDPAGSFTSRLEARLGGLAERSAELPAAAELSLLCGPGADAELREVAQRIRSLLDAGTRPEEIAVVSRALDVCAVPLRLHFGRLGIPFSGHDRHGPPGPAGRRLAALVELLRRGERTPADRWLDALGFLPELGSQQRPEPRRNRVRADLSLALHALGAGRLRDVAELDLGARLGERKSLALPVRRGLAGSSTEDDALRAPRRHLGREHLEAAVERAGRLCRWLESAQRPHESARRIAALRALAADELGWSDAVPGSTELEVAIASLAQQLGEHTPLEHADLVLLLERALADRGCELLGGNGAGVQVLDVTQARARSFEQLFLIGLNRDVFPRTIREDPLLSDTLRLALEEALPGIPVKRRGHQEEAYLYAQLLASSAHVTLSWQTMDEDGVARSPSSLIVRQQLAQPDRPVHHAAPLWTPAGTSGPRPAHEHAVLAGLYGSVSDASAALEASLRHEQAHTVDPAQLARVRANTRREFDGTFAQRGELGPWFGFVGPMREPGDPRRDELYVTTLEGVGRCPWQAFLRRFLRVEATPDALDALPELSALVLGKTVHRALEEIVLAATGERREGLDALRGKSSVAVPWPDAGALEALLQAAAREALLEEGVELPGFASALASQARPYLERARELVWGAAGGNAAVLGAEVQGTLEIASAAGAVRPLHFRADLVDRAPAGLRLTDYKTGRPLSQAVQAKTRRRHLRDHVRHGTSLQALAYRIGSGEAGATGRYLFLRPDLPDELANVELGSDDELERDFRETAATLLAGVEAGSFLPRLLDDGAENEPRTCEYCEVAEACVRGDSTARRRLGEWAGREDGANPEARALFRLGAETAE